MVKKTPSIGEPIKLLKFLNEVRKGHEEPADTSAIFIEDSLSFFYFWADSDEYPKKSLKFKTLLWTNHLSYAVVTLAMCAYLFVTEMNIFEFADAFCYAVAIIQCTAKSFFVQYKRKDLTYVINTLNNMNHKLLRLCKKDSTIQTLRSTYFVNEMLITLGFVILATITNGISACKIFMPLPPQMPGNAVFPYDTTPYGFPFLASYTFVAITHFMLGINYSLIDPGIGCNYNQVVLHFTVLGVKLRKLGYKEKEVYKNNLEKFNEVCNRNLDKIYREYRALECLVDQCNDIFGPFFRFLVAASMIHFVFLTFVASITLRKDIGLFLSFFSFLSYMFGTFFYWCYLGNQLQIQSSALLLDSYYCNWEECDQKFKKGLLRFMLRVGKPLQYHAKPIFVFNYDMFTSIVRKAFSYLAVLQDINAKKY